MWFDIFMGFLLVIGFLLFIFVIWFLVIAYTEEEYGIFIAVLLFTVFIILLIFANIEVYIL